MNIVVFVSGRGSNLEAILNSELLKGKINVTAVVSDKLQCGAFEIAKRNSISTYTVGDKEGCISYPSLGDIIVSQNTDLIVLAGFLKLIPGFIVSGYKNKIINVHPALLPSFGGKGLYGMNVHKAVFESSAKVSGPTVHFVDETYDTGRIIAQKCVDISDVASPEEVAAKVLEAEHKLLPFVISKFAEGKIKIVSNRVIIN